MNLHAALALFWIAACAQAPPTDTPTPLPSGTAALVSAWQPAAVEGTSDPGFAAGFEHQLLAEGLSQPTAVRVLPDGRLLVTEQRGIVQLVDRHGSPTALIDLRSDVFHRYQQGLLGLALDPEFDAQPFVYLAYTRDARLGGQSPTYGQPQTDVDECVGGRQGCPASARLGRFRLDGDRAGPFEPLLDDWCVSGPNHTIGTILFDRHGALIMGAGDGADGREVDHGQLTAPPNACSDPGADAPESVDSEGGSLRSQDLLTLADPVGLSGTLIRIDRATGAALPDNPLFGAADENARRIIAYGLRNPFRFAARPGTDELWLADVGWNQFEEVNRLSDPLDGEPPNFGWPCYEGPLPQPAWAATGSRLCQSLFESPTPELTFPALSFKRAEAGSGCDRTPVVLSALAFYDGHAFPAEYDGALLLGDTGRQCIWALPIGPDGLPDPAHAVALLSGPAVVDLQVRPDGALLYVDVFAGTVGQLTWAGDR